MINYHVINYHVKTINLYHVINELFSHDNIYNVTNYHVIIYLYSVLMYLTDGCGPNMHSYIGLSRYTFLITIIHGISLCHITRNPPLSASPLVYLICNIALKARVQRMYVYHYAYLLFVCA